MKNRLLIIILLAIFSTSCVRENTSDKNTVEPKTFNETITESETTAVTTNDTKTAIDITEKNIPRYYVRIIENNIIELDYIEIVVDSMNYEKYGIDKNEEGIPVYNEIEEFMAYEIGDSCSFTIFDSNWKWIETDQKGFLKRMKDEYGNQGAIVEANIVDGKLISIKECYIP